jgi:hypothetical protein
VPVDFFVTDGRTETSTICIAMWIVTCMVALNPRRYFGVSLLLSLVVCSSTVSNTTASASASTCAYGGRVHYQAATKQLPSSYQAATKQLPSSPPTSAKSTNITISSAP